MKTLTLAGVCLVSAFVAALVSVVFATQNETPPVEPVTVVVTNLFYAQPLVDQRDTLRSACAAGDIVVAAEANHLRIDGDCGYEWLGTYNRIGWNPNEVRLVRSAETRCPDYVAAEGTRQEVTLVCALPLAVFDRDGNRFAVVGVHWISKAWTGFVKRKPTWRAQRQATLDFIAAELPENMPVVLTGDMNRPGDFDVDGFDEVFSPPTHPAENPARRLDRVFTRGIDAEVVGTVRSGSDHLALQVEVG